MVDARRPRAAGRRRYERVGAAGSGAVESLRYDELVVGTGGREPVQDVPGLAEHGFTLRSPGDIGACSPASSVLEHPAAGREPADLVVVGGGFAGVELAAALAARPTRSAAAASTSSTPGAAVLPQLRDQQPGLARRAERELERLGVARALRSPRRLRRPRSTSSSPTVAGLPDLTRPRRPRASAPYSCPGLEALPTDDTGRLLTTPDLAVAPGIWAAGDAARVNHPRTRDPVPANALWAIKAGDHLGRNLARTRRGPRARTPFRYLGLGQAASFGVGRGVAELYGLPLTGWVAWVTRLAFFIRFMPSHANAVETLAFLVSRRSALPSVAGFATGPSPVAAPDPACGGVHVAAAGAVRAARPPAVPSTVDERAKVA